MAALMEEATQAQPVGAPIEWRCYHCGDVFTDDRCARLHFGRDEDSTPACQIKAGAEQGLLSALREAEYAAADAQAAIANECTEAARAYYAQATRHNQALRNAEELGYERGLADGRAHSEPRPVAGEDEETAYRKWWDNERNKPDAAWQGSPYRAAFAAGFRLATHSPAPTEAGIPDDIAAHVRKIGRVEWGQTPAHDAEGHGRHVADSVRMTAAHFGQTDDQHMHGLWLVGTETVLCHTGTSPNAPKTTQALVGAWNWLVDQVKASTHGGAEA